EPRNQHLVREMHRAGYHTAMIGKWHLKAEPAAFDYYCVLPGQGKYHDPEFRLRGEKAWPSNTVQHTGKHSSDAITDLTIDWLRTGWDRTKPFFVMHHFKAPHDMFQNAARYDSYLEEVEIPEPDNLYNQPAEGAGSVATRGVNDSLISKIGAGVTKRSNTWRLGQRLGIDDKLPDPEFGRQTYQRYLKRYLRCVKGVDDNVKRLLDYLRQNGTLDNTVILYTGDQGFFLGEHDLMDKRWMYEEAFRMPFL
ncbi:MAG: sulfatase-like hydrolase/transferase, partial [bacterium]|nr:sulfatase-like hydrolase/transferase [bacterium]